VSSELVHPSEQTIDIKLYRDIFLLEPLPEDSLKYIPFQTPIDRLSVEGLMTQLNQANAPRIVFVDSPGGEFEFFSVVGPQIQRRGITTLAGEVASAAVILYLLGHERLALPSSTFFFHEVRTLVNENGAVTLTDLQSVREFEREMSGQKREVLQHWYNQMALAQRWFIHFIHERTGLSSNVFLNLMRSEATLSASDALRYGIVHRVRQDQEVFS
jgi:ATP-dependent protease ClpP protease subunit